MAAPHTPYGYYAPPPGVLNLKRTLLEPPLALYTTGSESLIVEVRPFVAHTGPLFTITGRVLLKNGTVYEIRQSVQTLLSGYLRDTISIPLPEGFLLAVTVEPEVEAQRGDIWVRCFIGKGVLAANTLFRTQLLFADYYHTDGGLCWPNGRALSPEEGRGMFRSVAGSAPAAGAEWSETVPQNCMWRLIAVTATLTTNADVANRDARFSVDDGGAGTLWRGGSNVAVTASSTAVHTMGAGGAFGQTHSTQRLLSLPPDLWLKPTMRVRSITTALRAGDQWSAPRFFVEQLYGLP